MFGLDWGKTGVMIPTHKIFELPNFRRIVIDHQMVDLKSFLRYSTISTFGDFLGFVRTPSFLLKIDGTRQHPLPPHLKHDALDHRNFLKGFDCLCISNYFILYCFVVKIKIIKRECLFWSFNVVAANKMLVNLPSWQHIIGILLISSIYVNDYFYWPLYQF